MRNTYKTILVENYIDGVKRILLSNPSGKNSITSDFLEEMHSALDEVEANDTVKVLLLEGQGEYFCSGMDFNVSEKTEDKSEMYSQLLSRLYTLKCVVICFIEGKIMAGGIGIAAVSDLIIAGSNAQFSLPEIIWGMLPAIVFPYLARRIGVQEAKRMMLTYAVLTAEEAHKISLVDYVEENPVPFVKRMCFRLAKLKKESISEAKQFTRELFPIDENINRLAHAESVKMMKSYGTLANIQNYVKSERLPWESE